MNSKVLWGIVAVLVILGGIYWLATSGTPKTSTENALQEGGENVDAPNSTQGRVVFSITDAAVNMSTLSEVNMTVSKVEIYNQARGWVSVSSTPKTYNLLELDAKNQSKLLADVNTVPGQYSQVRMTVDKVMVKTKAGVTKEARLPGKMIAISTTLIVSGDTTSSVNFDVLADKSLHITDDGDYIFASVVKTETKSSATVTTDATSVVSISGGTVDSSNTVGMDIDGSVKVDFELKSATKLDIDANGVIKIQ